MRANLARLFNADEATLDKLFSGKIQLLKRDCDEATAEKYRYIRDQEAEQLERGLPFGMDDRLPTMPEWESQIQQLEEIQALDGIKVESDTLQVEDASQATSVEELYP